MVIRTKWLILSLALSITACSGDGQQQGTEEVVSNSEGGEIPENGALTNNPNSLGNEAGGNAESGNQAQGNSENIQNAGNGEQVNNAEGEDFGVNEGGNNQFATNEGNQSGGNNFLAENEGMGGEGVNNATMGEDSVDGDLAANGGGNVPANPILEAPVTDNSVSPVVDNAAMGSDLAPQSTEAATDTAAQTPVGPTTAPIVKYVPGTGADIYTQAGGTEIVGKFNQGDHPLVWDNGEWARLSDGKFVQNSALTTNPVPRPKRPAQWQ